MQHLHRLLKLGEMEKKWDGILRIHSEWAHPSENCAFLIFLFTECLSPYWYFPHSFLRRALSWIRPQKRRATWLDPCILGAQLWNKHPPPPTTFCPCAAIPHAEAPGRKGQAAAAPKPKIRLCKTSAEVPEGMRPPWLSCLAVPIPGGPLPHTCRSVSQPRLGARFFGDRKVGARKNNSEGWIFR